MRRGGPFVGAWPRGERELSRTEKIELQERLISRGYNTGATDGVIGPNTVAAIRAYQTREGLTPDGFADASLLPTSIGVNPQLTIMALAARVAEHL